MFFIFIFPPMTGSSQDANKNYKSEWKKVESFERAGLPKSALEEVNKIYNLAKKDRQSAQMIKALVTRLELEEELTDNDSLEVIASLKTEIEGAKEPEKSILYSLLASAYLDKYQSVRWDIMHRTPTSGPRSSDPDNWSVSDFMDEIGKYYFKSIEQEEVLKATSLEALDAIIEKGNVRNLRPTLFDLLAHEALIFFSGDEHNITRPAYAFEINQPEAFAEASVFSGFGFETKDTLSNEHKTLQLFQKLLSFHLKDSDPTALIDVDIHRISYVYSKSVHPDKEQLYQSALKQIVKKYHTNSASAQASFLLAQIHMEKAQTYQPDGDTTNRYNAAIALKIADPVIKQFPKSEGGINLRNLKAEIEQEKLAFYTEKVVIPKKPFLISIEYSNLSTTYFRVVKATEHLKSVAESFGSNSLIKTLQKQSPVRSWSQAVPATRDHQLHRVEVKSEGLDVGEYYLIASSEKTFNADLGVQAVTTIHVSHISFVNQGNDYFVLHRDTGAPLEGVNVQAWKQVYSNNTKGYVKEKGESYRTDANGFFKLTSEKTSDFRGIFLEMTKGKDRLFIDEMQYGRPMSQQKEPEEALSMFFFTDRSIYRPGQTVYFKGILLSRKDGEKKSEIVAGKNQVIQIFDANAQKVDSVKTTTNDFGSVSGTFVLPVGGINGRFRIEAKGVSGAASFSVEEYKRPKYKVDIEKPEQAFKLNEEILVTGQARAFAGNNIDGALVKYRVERVARFPYPWRFGRGWWPTSAPVQMASGETTTDREGRFQVKFKALADKSVSPDLEPVFDYVVYADVTDGAGETRSAKETISAGYQSVLLSVLVPERIELDSLREILVKTENLNGRFIPMELKMTARKLTPEKRLIRDRLWKRPDQFIMSKKEFLAAFPHDEYDDETDPKSWPKGEVVLSSQNVTKPDGKWLIHDFSKLSTGFYELEFVAADSTGEEVKDRRVVEVVNAEKPLLSRPEYIWGIPSGVVEPGEDAVIKLGSSAEKLFVIQTTEKLLGPTTTDRKYDFFSGKSGLKSHTFSVTEEDRGGYGVNFLFVKNNRVHQFQDRVKVPWTNKELTVSYGTFRDKVLPGSNETWTLTIAGSKGEKVAAELLAGMYDTSLDAFSIHKWQKPGIWWDHVAAGDWNRIRAFGARAARQVNWMNREGYQSYEKDYDNLISIQGKSTIAYSTVMDTSPLWKARTSTPAMANAPVVEESLLNEKVVVGFGTEREGTEAATSEQKEMGLDQPARKDFRETAFFFPQLKTNADGQVTFSFVLPEALTKWTFQAFSHTKDLAFGYSTQEIVTQKELMVQPNIPRFVRVGDKISITSKVVNLSDKILSGTAKLSVMDAYSGVILDDQFGIKGGEVSFTVAPGQSISVQFPIQVPETSLEPVNFRIVAKAGAFSDGEENLVPVLTNQMLVTETLPLSLRGTGTKNFTFDKLLKSKPGGTLRNHALAVEYTANPAWYAVQALPYLMEYPYDCAEQTWNRYYGNALAAHIANSSPRIEQIFKTWRDLDSSALLSNLEKNQELKSLLLEETPWVLAAKGESEQKRDLALLFDLVKMKAEASGAVTKLKEMQQPGGAFPWFQGGADDRFVTQYVLTGIGHLNKLVKIDPTQKVALDQIVESGLDYLDSKLARDYDLLLKSKADLKKYSPSPIIFQYLYMRSFFPDMERSADAEKAYDFYMRHVAQSWVGENKYLQAMTALTMSRKGDRKVADAIMKSLKETAITNPVQGTYWKSARRSWWWQEAPIEQHALLVEAFEEVAQDKEMADGIRTWLLSNKRTNRWESTKATAEACYALLLRGTEWLNDNPEVNISLGSQALVSEDRREAGTGYFKSNIPGSEVTAEKGKIKVSVSGSEEVKNRPSWGGVYWQYFENLDKITFSETPLKLKKELFVETNTDRGPVLKQMADVNEVKVGDKLKVRILLSVDRDMEYVHMKDMRASGLEPVNVLSSNKWQGGLFYYESTKDAATNFFFSYLPKGNYVFEYPLNVSHQGDFSNGVTTIQCMYAPEFTAHSEGLRLRVK